MIVSTKINQNTLKSNCKQLTQKAQITGQHVNEVTFFVKGNSMPTNTLFCRPIPDFDEIWQAWGSTEETNPHQVSAHFNHF